MTVDHYRRLAGLYDPATTLFLDPVRRLVRDTLRGLEARRVLDVCCGTGRQTLLLRRSGLTALGIDASPSMLTAARLAGRGENAFGRMDARRLAFADATFDAAVMALALHENEEADRLAIGREMARVTRPGGHLLFVDYAFPAALLPLGWLVTLAERLAGARHYRNYRDFMVRKGVAGFAHRLGQAVLATSPCLGGRAALVVLGPQPAVRPVAGALEDGF